MPEVPEVVVARLPLYVRALKQLLSEGWEVVSSQQLGKRLSVTPAQIRKDLGYFGRFGKQGRGYNVRHLAEELTRILGLDRDWDVAVVGMGRLGRAIVEYPGFNPEGFQVVAAFDSNAALVGQTLAGVNVQSVEDMPTVLRQRNIRIAIAAVPAQHTQEVVDRLVDCGVQAILNYAPTSPQVPPGVQLRNIDPVLALQSMTYYVHSPRGQRAHGRTGVRAPASGRRTAAGAQG